MSRRIFSIMFIVVSLSMALYAITPTISTSPQKNKNTRGEQLYQTYCASCHGTSGKGDGPAAAALKKAPPDVTRVPKQDGKFPGTKIRRIIAGEDFIQAHGSREMPVWGDYFRQRNGSAMSSANVYALTKYIESIQAN